MSLKTKVVEASNLETTERLESSKYEELLNKYSQPPYVLQNYGLRSLATNNIYLTLDLCPSSKEGYESVFFKELIKNYSVKKAVPVTLFVSSRWITAHEESFLELIRYEKEGKLNVTWGNHSKNHYYDPLAPLKRNFLLKTQTDILQELLDVEKLLLSYGVTPSILMRFPGLVSNKKAIEIVKSLGLISVGSNAWLAKGELITDGAIILLHGNKNEPYGIQKARQALFTKSHDNKEYEIGALIEDLK